MYPVIDFHSTWIAVNPIQGCVKRCNYCFLQSQNLTGVKPNILCEPNETFEYLINHRYYTEDTPLAFFTQTDIFATKENISYLANVVSLIEENNLTNPIILITKCKIPIYIIKKLSQLIKKGFKITVYLSYSGLEDDVEKGVTHEHIRANFINLFEYKVPIIHYMRPITPKNGTYSKMKEVIGFTSNYTNITIFAGLKVQKEFIEKISFWPNLNKDLANKECIYPSEAMENLKKIKLKYPNQKIFHLNACGLASSLHEPERFGFYLKSECLASNCSNEQRRRCANYYEKKIWSVEKVDFILREKCGYTDVKWSYEKEKNLLTILNAKATVGEQAYIRSALSVDIKIDTREDYYWNTSINNTESIEIKDA